MTDDTTQTTHDTPRPHESTAQKVSVTFSYHPDGLPAHDLFVLGSWDDNGEFQENWIGEPVPMTREPDGSHRATVDLVCENGQSFWWGVKDQHRHWMLFEREAICFHPYTQRHQSFVLGYRHLLGIHPDGKDGFRASVWAPHAKEVALLVQTAQGDERYPMESCEQLWRVSSEKGWQKILGRPYGFELLTSCGQTVLRADPYARVRQGPQKGVGDLYLDVNNNYAHRYNVGDDGTHLLRFEAVPERGKTLESPPVLKLFRDDVQLSAADLRDLCQTEAKLPDQRIWWVDHLKPNGDIPLTRSTETEAYSVAIGPEKSLHGLRFTLEDDEGTVYHDPWSQLLDGHHNWARLGVVQPPREIKKCHAIPLSLPTDLVIYELHIGSLLGEGGNLRSSNFEEVAEQLLEIKKLGFNTIQLLPTNATEGNRDWGYLGTASFAHQEAYAAPGSDAERSLVAFIEQAHRLGMRVFNDVVYNHVGGFHNDLWEFDGLENSWFERNLILKGTEGALPYRPYGTTAAPSRTHDPSVRNTPWGPIPAYTKGPVRQFFVDHALDQVSRLGFDGLRFDFTNLIHAHGAGDKHGWEMLRSLHRRLEYFYPHVLTFAEEFPPHPIITQPVDSGGAGFTGMWNTEHQHRLIYSNHHPSVTSAMINGQEPPLDSLLQHMLAPEGFSDPTRSVTVLSNHDEVGNAKRLYQLVTGHPRGYDIARLVSWFSLLCPGYPILFQGTEDLADNYFSWGLPHTWDVAGHLSDEDLPGYRTRHLAAIKEVLLLRQREPDLWADSPITEFYRDTLHHVLGFRRGQFWIVANFCSVSRSLPIRLTGEATLVLNSERSSYDYQGKKTRGPRIGSYSLKVWEHP